MLIRPATPADAAAILPILMPIFRAGETYPLPRDISEADALAYWFAPDKTVFVAVRDDGLVAGTYYLKANTGGGGAHVANCGYGVLEQARGHGVARALCAHSLQAARAAGFLAMQFNLVISTNAVALHLWQAMGFVQVGRLPGAFAHPQHGYVDALVLYQQL